MTMALVSRSRRRHLYSIAVATGLLVSASACSVPRSGPVEPIADKDIPYELNVATTSSPPTTLVPTSTSLPSIDTTTSTSVSTIPSETVRLFFIAGGQVVPIERILLSPATPTQILAALSEGLPEGDITAGLRSSLPLDFAFLVSVSRGIATIDLPPTFITDLPGAEQRLAIAQIVLTLTRRAGIGQVRFTSESEPQSVPRGRGDLTPAGGEVACDDYANLLPTGFAC